MRMMMIITILIFFWTWLAAPPNREVYILSHEPVRPYEAIWNATCKVESDFNSLAVGDRHLKEWSYGIAQLRRVRIEDFNKRTGSSYTINDAFSPEISKRIFLYYATEIGPYDMEKVARCWNSGPKGMSKKSTVKYWQLIQKHLQP
jgi:hypothetical protein